MKCSITVGFRCVAKHSTARNPLLARTLFMQAFFLSLLVRAETSEIAFLRV